MGRKGVFMELWKVETPQKEIILKSDSREHNYCLRDSSRIAEEGLVWKWEEECKVKLSTYEWIIRCAA